MAAMKYILILALAAFSVQADSFNTEKYENYYNHIAQTLEESLHKAAKDAEHQINISLKEINNEIDNDFSETINAFQKAQQFSSDIQGDIIECVKKHIPELIELRKKAHEGLKQCVEPIREQLRAILQEALAAIRNGREAVRALIAELRECTDSDCRKAVAKKIAEQVVGSAQEVRAIARKAIDLIKENGQILTCAVPVIREWNQGRLEVAKKIIACIKE